MVVTNSGYDERREVHLKEQAQQVANSKEKRNPSIPLTKLELKAIAGVRFNKQYNKRLLLILIPVLVVFVAGVAFLGSFAWTGFILIVMAVAGFIAGAWVLSRWMQKVVAQFAAEHDGIFWLEDTK